MPPSRTSSTKPSEGTCVTGSVLTPKRVSVRATPSQLAELTRSFQSTPRPSKESKDALAERTGLTVTWINSWFMRERKKVHLESISNGAESRIDNVTPAALSPQAYHAPLVSEAAFHDSASTAQTNRSSTSATSRAASTVPSSWTPISIPPPIIASFASANAGAPLLSNIPVSTLHLINARLLQNHMRFLQPQVAQALQTSVPPAYTPDPHSAPAAAVIPNALTLATVLGLPGTAAENNTSEIPRPSSSLRLALNFPQYVPHTSHFVAIPTLPHPPSFYTHPSPSSYRQKSFGVHQDFNIEGEDTESTTTVSDFTDYLKSRSDVPVAESLDEQQHAAGSEGEEEEEATPSRNIDSDQTCAPRLADSVSEATPAPDGNRKMETETVGKLNTNGKRVSMHWS